MDRQIYKAVRMPRKLVARIDRVTKAEGSTFSQFVRTAAIKELNEKKKTAA